MEEFDSIIGMALAEEPLGRNELEVLLRADAGQAQLLFQAARSMRARCTGNLIYLRGLIEISNVCTRDCLYCGIRRSNFKAHRYTLDEDGIAAAARRAARLGYGSAVLQAGERRDESWVEMIGRAVRRIAAENGPDFGITLSLGGQSEETYRRWKAAGAHRYLLRIEEASPRLFAAVHPAGYSIAERRRALTALRKTGYQVGTGVMSALPGQNETDLAEDLLFFKSIDADMIGMGPYIPHPDTPLAREAGGWNPEKALFTGLKMIAVCRLLLRDVNIASTTALQSLSPDGRALGLQAGANVIMPNIGPDERKRDYLLYAGKPVTDEGTEAARKALESEALAAGAEIARGISGDPRHYLERLKQPGGDAELIHKKP